MRSPRDDRVFLLFLLGAKFALLLFDAIYPFARHRQFTLSRLQGIQPGSTVAPDVGDLSEQALSLLANRRDPLILLGQQRLKLRDLCRKFKLGFVSGSAGGMKVHPLPPIP